MPVIDASVLVAYLGEGVAADAAGEVIAGERESLFSPHLVDAEVGHALRRLVAAGELDADHAEAALADLADLPIHRSPHTWLLEAAWRLRANLSFYDGLYLALAEELGLRLVTLDRRMAAGARRLPVEVELLPEG